MEGIEGRDGLTSTSRRCRGLCCAPRLHRVADGRRRSHRLRVCRLGRPPRTRSRGAGRQPRSRFWRGQSHRQHSECDDLQLLQRVVWLRWPGRRRHTDEHDEFLPGPLAPERSPGAGPLGRLLRAGLRRRLRLAGQLGGADERGPCRESSRAGAAGLPARDPEPRRGGCLRQALPGADGVCLGVAADRWLIPDVDPCLRDHRRHQLGHESVSRRQRAHHRHAPVVCERVEGCRVLLGRRLGQHQGPDALLVEGSVGHTRLRGARSAVRTQDLAGRPRPARLLG